jgi:hypothetical protein
MAARRSASASWERRASSGAVEVGVIGVSGQVIPLSVRDYAHGDQDQPADETRHWTLTLAPSRHLSVPSFPGVFMAWRQGETPDESRSGVS